MKSPKEVLLQEIVDKYGEWLEMAGARAPVLIIEILCKMVIELRDKQRTRIYDSNDATKCRLVRDEKDKDRG
jgi:hypothetical protein